MLDIGCGPGRHVAALAAAGHEALGLDLSPVAVRLARARGAEAILRSVFADVPAAGCWRDGAAARREHRHRRRARARCSPRARELVAPGGAILVETGPPGSPTRCGRVRLEAPGAVSEWFGWARVGVDGIEPLARAAGLVPAGRIRAGRRWFARLVRAMSRRRPGRSARASGSRRCAVRG